MSVNVAESADAFSISFLIQNRVASYADLATSTKLMEDVIDDLNLNLSPEALADSVEAEVVPETSLIDVTVRDPDARQAQTTAGWLADRFAEYLTSLETPTGSDEPTILANVTDAASYDPSPVAPRTILYLIIAGLVGLLVGLATALTREILDRTISAQSHIREVTELTGPGQRRVRQGDRATIHC